MLILRMFIMWPSRPPNGFGANTIFTSNIYIYFKVVCVVVGGGGIKEPTTCMVFICLHKNKFLQFIWLPRVCQIPQLFGWRAPTLSLRTCLGFTRPFQMPTMFKCLTDLVILYGTHTTWEAKNPPFKKKGGLRVERLFIHACYICIHHLYLSRRQRRVSTINPSAWCLRTTKVKGNFRPTILIWISWDTQGELVHSYNNITYKNAWPS